MRAKPRLVQVDITFLITLKGTDRSARIVTSLLSATICVLKPMTDSLTSSRRSPMGAMVAAKIFRNYDFEMLSGQVSTLMSEQHVGLLVGVDNDAILIDDDHGIRA